jgi:DNA-binding response OmpR family regulator
MSAVRARGPLVLVVGEVAAARDQFAVELVGGGFKVLEAVDAITAVEKALRFGPHAVVLDLALPVSDGRGAARVDEPSAGEREAAAPGTDGLEVARRLRGEPTTSGVAILALADLPVEKAEATALAAGCDAYMCKPLLGAALVGEVVRLLGARRH